MSDVALAACAACAAAPEPRRPAPRPGGTAALRRIDLSLPSGNAIEIEERAGEEVRTAAGALLTVPGTPVRNPAFDVTPAAFVWALVTERGIAQPVDAASTAAVA